MYYLCFSEKRTVQVVQFGGQHLWVFCRKNILVWWEGPVENILRGEWCCCEIDASGSVSSPRRWRLVEKRWWFCQLYQTLCRPSERDAGMWLHTSCIRYHGYKDSCGWCRLSQILWICWKFFQQHLILYYWMAWRDHDGIWRMHAHWVLGSTLLSRFLLDMLA